MGEALQVIGRRDLPPGGLSTGSNRAVLWACSQCGTQWTATVASRARSGSGCPLCAQAIRGRSRAAVARGRTSADEKAPHLWREFVENLTRRGWDLSQVLPATRDRCRWRCAACGHEWTASVSNRVLGRGCPTCANASRAAQRAALRQGQLAASAAWPHLEAEFRRNLRRPGVPLADTAANSSDRCEWSCLTCGHVYAATIANRGLKGSGCPRCAPGRWAATRMTPGRGLSLAELQPILAAQFIENVSRPGRKPSTIPAGANDNCRWRCDRGHEWMTTVAARVSGQTGCPRCGRSGQSRLEFEVAGLLASATGSTVLTDTGSTTDIRVDACGRSWRVDIAVERRPERVLIDLDPPVWHQDAERDARKAQALHEHDYLRVRPVGLPRLGPPAQVVTFPGPTTDPPAAAWVEALRGPLQARGLSFRMPGPNAVADVLAEAARLWQDRTGAAPAVSAATVRPGLLEEYVANTTRPGVGLELLPPSSKDQCLWHCAACGHRWRASVGSRCGSGRSRGRGTGCPPCALAAGAQRSRVRGLPDHGLSLLDLHPSIARSFVVCLTNAALSAAEFRPASNRRCRWHCPDCGSDYEMSVASRVRGRDCPTCSRKAGAKARRRPAAGESLADRHPLLAAEFVDCPSRPAVMPPDLAPGANVHVDWRCGACRHVWSATVASRAAGTGCPSCARQRTIDSRTRVRTGAALADLRPDLAAQWSANETRPGRGPSELTCGSHDRCRWRCPACDGTWTATVKNRARNGTRCPSCARAAPPRAVTRSTGQPLEERAQSPTRSPVLLSLIETK